MSYTNIPEIELKFKSGKVKKFVFKQSKDVEVALRHFFDEDTIELTESFVVVYLNRANKTIGWQKISQGGITSTVVDLKLIMATALKCGASALILSHNHPSGNLKPSKQDIDITTKIKNAAKLFEINVLDHLILTDSEYYSFADNLII